MRVLIGRTFKYDKEDKLFIRGKDYAVNRELGNWIAHKKLGSVLPEVKTDGKGNLHLKDIVKDRMVHEEKVETKQKKKKK